MNINEVRSWNELIVPYVKEEICSCQQLVATLHHVSEQPELARTQINLPVATLRDAIDEIKLQ